MHEIEQIIDGYRAKIGEVLGVTEDFSIRQSEIDVFGALTQNIDPMHNDPEWGKEGPWGSTIVHGLFLLSYVAKFWKEIGVPIYTNEKMYSLIYGLNRVRFISPFLVDVPGRATVRLLDVEDKGEKRFLLPSEITVNQDGSKKPNMVAELLAMIVCT
ncbi:MAG: MaoC/PaaZ C-terminal domain-containing protein [Rhodospirillales bacterium]|nr:MaoC/PaaZ C-terminal domain-containing protein [Rhodospirillales bacterium]